MINSHTENMDFHLFSAFQKNGHKNLRALWNISFQSFLESSVTDGSDGIAHIDGLIHLT